MILTTHLAQMLAIILFFLGLGMVIHVEAFKKAIAEIGSSYSSMYLVSIITLAAGSAMIVYHNVWKMDWSVGVTIFGWFLFILSLCRLFFYEHVMHSMSKASLHNGFVQTIGIISIILGLYFGYLGFYI